MPHAAADRLRARRFLLGSLAVLAVASFFLLTPFFSGILFALVGGYLLQRPMRALAGWVRWRPLAAGLLVALVVLAVCIPFVLVAWLLAGDAQAFVQRAGEQGTHATLEEALVSLGVPAESAAGLVANGIKHAKALVQENLGGTLGKLARLLANVGVFLVVLFFVLTGGDGLAGLLRRAIPLPGPQRDRLLDTVGQRVRALFLGTFLVAAVQGGVAALGWWLLGFPAPLFWGFVMALLAVIPAVGPMLVLAPAGALAILQGRVFAGVALLAYGLAVVSLVDNVVRAVVVGRTASVHPAIVLLGTLGGLLVFGVTGFILGPLILSMVVP
ncbi:MAG TPA: AI-2E family transporter, partial [Candidatus Thermoplasmatota archaeon]|nr:AI-2E family transporter [Candidatus Thermoplasmatota archaeon]